MKVTNSSLKRLMILLIMGSCVSFFTACDDDGSDPTVENCTNGVDDDGDGDIDCADGDCATDATCGNTVLEGSIGTRTLNASVTYTIRGFAYVADGDVLTIPAGTILKAETGDGSDASALIVARGGRIEASGSANMPIIFTSVNDNIQPGQTASTLNYQTSAGLWGGLILLGKAPISDSDDNNEETIEGVPAALTFARYGGSSPADNSGTLRYVSLRFTGTELEANSEIQGLTLGGVGSGTTIEDLEIIASTDDGVECFGGEVNISRMLVVAQQDDGIDIDQSYDGTINNSLVLQYNPAVGNDANEIDGPEGSINADGKFLISNTTYVNKSGVSRGGTLKSGAQGELTNCLWVDFAAGIFVSGGGANANYLSGDLKVTNSEFVGSGTDISALISSDDGGSEAMIKTMFAGAGNSTTTTPTKGSTADFSWTWSNDLGILP